MAKNNADDLLISINITPFTDVVLVLLIIFMVAAPQIRKEALDIKLPKASAKGAAVSDNVKVHEIVVLNRNELFFDDSTIEINVFENYLKGKIYNGSDEVFAVSADASAPYQKVVTVLDIMRRQNIENVILRTEF
ncbi:MAG TPA: biopolymer transporter ExbD [Candidatus Wallbacteria bacterium]|nr:biopolymer transporter ExbD [Candidatus Wallbacteria bacterium]